MSRASLTRRTMLQGTAGSLLTTGAARANALAPPESSHEGALVVVLLRGGADGLSLLVPYADPHYPSARPTTAVAPRSVLALDRRFALHPRLAPLAPLYERRELAFWVAVGQLELETSHRAAERRLMADLARLSPNVEREADPAKSLPLRLRTLAHDIRHDRSPRVVVVPSNGWDTHAAQGDEHGRLAERLDELGAGLSAFHGAMEGELDRATLVVLSEFGRSIDETAMRGTDDGHATTAIVLGGGIDGGKILGRFPGLAPPARSHGRHLAVTTTIRQLLAALGHGGDPLET